MGSSKFLEGKTMKKAWVILVLTTVIFACDMFLPQSAAAKGFQFEDARWRVELNAVTGTYSGKTDRKGDFLATGYIEYECPVLRRSTFGFKFYPLFIYSEPKTIYGAGVGISARVYKNAKDRTGLFGEVSGSVFLQSNEFRDNTSNVNYMSEVGVGYKFVNNPWHVSAKFIHVSNGGMGARNAGINGFSAGFGYTF